MWTLALNAAAIVAGGIFGSLAGNRLSRRIAGTMSCAVGIVILVIGMKMALLGDDFIRLLLTLVLGGAIGAFLSIGARLQSAAHALEERFLRSSHGKQGEFAYAFLNTSLVMCIGSMAILGPFQMRLQGVPTLLLAKSAIDGIAAISFAASLGIGVAFASLPVFVVQLVFYIAAPILNAVADSSALVEVNAVGGCVLVMTGINMLEIKKIDTANFIPAIFLAFFVAALL